MSNKRQYTRKFKGKLDNFDSKYEKYLEEKHLKAYLKGAAKYAYGYDDTDTSLQKRKLLHNVKEESVGYKPKFTERANNNIFLKRPEGSINNNRPTNNGRFRQIILIGNTSKNIIHKISHP